MPGAKAVFIGYSSALALHKQIPLLPCLAHGRSSATPPHHSPTQEQIVRALDALEMTCAFHGQHWHHAQGDLPLDILVSSPQHQKKNGRMLLHTLIAQPPRDSFMKMDDGLYIATIPLALVQIAQHTPFITLLLLLWEACGTYRTGLASEDCLFDTPPLCTTKSLLTYVMRCPAHMRGATRLEYALKFVRDGSASPRETICALLLSLPKKQGGYGFGLPLMNYAVENTGGASALSQRGLHRLDLCWPSNKVGVEYQSKAFHQGEEHRISDSKRENALKSMGWIIFNITNAELESRASMNVIARSIGKALGKRQRSDDAGFAARNEALRRDLGLRPDLWL